MSFNCAATIADTIRSVAEQSFLDVEHIIIDGASKDNTLDEVRRAGGRVTTIVSEPDKGIYDAMNKGIARAKGEIIGFLNADDFYSSNQALQSVADAMANGADSCHGDLCYVGQTDSTKVIRYWKSSKFSPRLFEKGWCPPHPTFFVRRAVYESFGVFRPEFGVASDVELMARLLEGAKISNVYIPHILVNMRMGGASNRSILGIFKQNMQVRRALRSLGLDFSLIKFAGHKLVSRGTQFIRRPQ